MRILIPAPVAVPDDAPARTAALAAHYAYPEPARPTHAGDVRPSDAARGRAGGAAADVPRAYVRASMVSSADGSAAVAQASAGVSSPADRIVFALLRGLADVILVGAGTVRAEGYRPVRTHPHLGPVRVAQGRAAAARLAVVSLTGRLDPASDLLTRSDPPVLLVTSARGAQRAPRAVLDAVDLVVAGEADVDLAAALDALAARGLTRVLCEGGPRLLADVAAAGLLDEVCLTVTPLLVGTGPRITVGAALRTELSLTGLVEDDATLLLRYRRAAATISS